MSILRRHKKTNNEINPVATSFEEFIQKVKDAGEGEVAEMIETRKFFIENSERAYTMEIHKGSCYKRIDFDQKRTFVLYRTPFAATYGLNIIDYNNNTTCVIC
jgi:hypothetical protein